ncbi:MAG: glycerol-3-phosphate dehydrogenase [Candidatus Azotimanducaceae bacterium]|jgi:glycerol-3-phosphate dehydrogenase|tara:strand:+ start:1040 stop:2572 length:1533 start_codon:yes stop_codon:yes gene_type:complete
MEQSDHAEADQSPAHYDTFVIGGGINGAGIARDAAGRNQSVCLCDSGDFGGGTSSASTKLVHGGLRYLEYYEFRLVREALIEREELLQMAPHIIWPLRFVLPHHSGLRPAWLLRLGLFLYDHLGGRKLLPATKTLDLTTDPAGQILKSDFTKGFEYSDCWIEDSRMVILNLQQAAENGAQILPRTAIRSAVYQQNKWLLTLHDTVTDETFQVTATVVVNSSGPWADEILKGVFGLNHANNVRLVGGSHIVIRRTLPYDRSYIFQAADDRVIFIIPYENDFLLVGTTDTENNDIHTPPKITQDEIDYLCEAASEYLCDAITPEDVVWTFSGVRPLYNDGASQAQEATRDYVVRENNELGGPLINVFGGKITTYRKLAEEVVGRVCNYLGQANQPWTSGTRLPGGHFPVDGYEDLVSKIKQDYAFISEKLARRLARLYGTDSFKMLAQHNSLADLGQHFGSELYAAEVDYLIANEWVQQADDLLYRRTKLGLVLSKDAQLELHSYLEQRQQN